MNRCCKSFQHPTSSLQLPESNRYKVETEFGVSHRKRRTGLRSNRYKLTVCPRTVALRESALLDDRRDPLHRPSNQFLIATPQIRNAPKPFEISVGTRSNRNNKYSLEFRQKRMQGENSLP